MNINWFGQSCFRLETKEGSVLIDPFSKELGLRPPRIKDSIILVTHEHYDHNNVDGILPESFLINHPGEYERKSIHIQGIQTFHDNVSGAERGLNTVYILKAENMVICHMGDFGQEALTDEQVEKIGDVDILMIPVGGVYTIGAGAAAKIVGQIEPKIIIPMHYKIPGLKMDIQGPEKFIKEIGLTPEKVEKYRIVKSQLPVEEIRLVVFTK